MLVVGSNLFAGDWIWQQGDLFHCYLRYLSNWYQNRQQRILFQKCIEMYVWVYVLLPPSCLLALIFCLFSAFLSSAIFKTLFVPQMGPPPSYRPPPMVCESWLICAVVICRMMMVMVMTMMVMMVMIITIKFRWTVMAVMKTATTLRSLEEEEE